MRKLFISFILLFLSTFSFVAQSKWSGNESPTYDELHLILKQLAAKHKEIELYNMGNSDYGLPIYVCIVNGAGDSTKTFEKAKNEIKNPNKPINTKGLEEKDVIEFMASLILFENE